MFRYRGFRGFHKVRITQIMQNLGSCKRTDPVDIGRKLNVLHSFSLRPLSAGEAAVRKYCAK